MSRPVARWSASTVDRDADPRHAEHDPAARRSCDGPGEQKTAEPGRRGTTRPGRHQRHGTCRKAAVVVGRYRRRDQAARVGGSDKPGDVAMRAAHAGLIALRSQSGLDGLARLVDAVSDLELGLPRSWRSGLEASNSARERRSDSTACRRDWKMRRRSRPDRGSGATRTWEPSDQGIGAASSCVEKRTCRRYSLHPGVPVPAAVGRPRQERPGQVGGDDEMCDPAGDLDRPWIAGDVARDGRAFCACSGASPRAS